MTASRGITVGLVLVALTGTTAGAAQRRAPVVPTESPQARAESRQSVPRPLVAPAVRQPPLMYPILGTVLGGVAGGLVGMAVWEVNHGGCTGELCPLGPLIYGGWGAFAAMPLGTHLGNARRGNLLLDYFVASLAGAAVVAFDRSEDAVGIAGVTFMVTSIAIERLIGGLREP